MLTSAAGLLHLAILLSLTMVETTTVMFGQEIVVTQFGRLFVLDIRKNQKDFLSSVAKLFHQTVICCINIRLIAPLAVPGTLCFIATTKRSPYKKTKQPL